MKLCEFPETVAAANSIGMACDCSDSILNTNDCEIERMSRGMLFHFLKMPCRFWQRLPTAHLPNWTYLPPNAAEEEMVFDNDIFKKGATAGSRILGDCHTVGNSIIRHDSAGINYVCLFRQIKMSFAVFSFCS